MLIDLQLKDSSHPLQVLTRCKDLCLRDRTAANNLVRTCSSIDFKPGKRLTQHTTLPTQLLSTSSSLSGAPSQIEYEESTCYLSREQARPEGLGATISSPGFFLFNEICLSCKSDQSFSPIFQRCYHVGLNIVGIIYKLFIS